jgi:hypothetical protein
MHICSHIHTYALCVRIYACTYMCMHAYLHAVASAILSSYVLFPLQAPVIKTSCTEMIDASDQKNK